MNIGRTTNSVSNVSAFLQLKDLLKMFGETVAVNQVNLSINRHEIFALLGSSGCGKSTLLRMLAGFEQPTAGQILLDGVDISKIPPHKRPVNMMFQSYALFPHMTIEDNVAFGLKQEKVPKQEIHERVFEALDLVQMAGFAKRKPSQLSGGQQQRVALARSLVKRPKLLLLDEPMSALDKQIRQKTQIELVNILDQVGVTCIMVTHDQDEAMTMADRIAVMTEGEVLQTGTPYDVYTFPNSKFVAGFIGSTNIFEGCIVVDEPDHVVIESPDLTLPLYVSHGISEPLGMDIFVSIRPEQMHLLRNKPDQQVNTTQGVITHLAWMGSYMLYQIQLETTKVIEISVPVKTIHDESPALGDEVYVVWGPDSGTVLSS